MKNSLSEKRDSLNKFYFEDMFRSPGKIVVVVFILVWLIGCSLMVLAMTDLFQKSFFNRRYIISYLFLAGATASVVRVIVAYYKARKQE